MVAVDKAANFLTIPDHWDSAKPNLLNCLQHRKPDEKIFVVHRLDMETSGIVLFAKTAAAHRHLCAQFESHEIKKIYFGIVIGRMEQNEGCINLPLSLSKKRKGTAYVAASGKKSITKWSLMERFRAFSFIRIQPKTGRMHQIRIHLRQVGHPLVADSKYGDRNGIYLSQIKRNYQPKENREERPLINRLALHAADLTFIHPTKNQSISLKSALPADFEIVLKNLKKYNSF